MKKQLCMWTIGLAAGLIAAQAAWAQMGVPLRDSHRGLLEDRLQRMTTDLQLTAEQQARLKAINEEELAATAKWNVEYQAAQGEYNAAIRAKDEVASNKAQEAMRAMGERRAAISKDATAKIRAVVTDAKWETWQVNQLADSWLRRFQAANLTDGQKEKIRTQCAEVLRAQESATNSTERSAAYRKLSETVQSMLSTEQRENVAADAMLQRVTRRLPDVDFTDEQKTKIKTLCQEAGKASAPAEGGKSAAASAFRSPQEIEKKIMDEVMTEPQRRALEGARLYQQISYIVSRCEPSPEQVARMKALCQDAAKDWASSTDYKIRSEKTKEVVETIRNTILTEAQRAKLPTPFAAARNPPLIAPQPPPVAPTQPPVAPTPPPVAPAPAPPQAAPTPSPAAPAPAAP